MNLLKIGLLPKVILAILLGYFLGNLCDPAVVRFFATFNTLFGKFLGFAIPLIILGLVVPGIADLGNKVGRLLLLTVLLAYVSTLGAGFFSYCSCRAIFPVVLSGNFSERISEAESELAGTEFDLGLLTPFFDLEIKPPMDVMAALLLAFILGIGMTRISGDTLRKGADEFRNIIVKLIAGVVIPLLPLHIFGIFLNMSHSGAAEQVITTFGKVIAVIFVLHVAYLLFQFVLAGAIAGRNPLRMLWTMLPAYATALGTASSAATIPVTLAQAKKMGVQEDIADFCIPLCATIHLSGSMLKIVATALALCMMDGLAYDVERFAGFIFLLGVMMIAAPGVPGGAIMAALGVLHSVLGFSEPQNALMIAIYVAIDSFGTAGNVTADGAIAAIVDRVSRKGTKSNVPADEHDSGT